MTLWSWSGLNQLNPMASFCCMRSSSIWEARCCISLFSHAISRYICMCVGSCFVVSENAPKQAIIILGHCVLKELEGSVTKECPWSYRAVWKCYLARRQTCLTVFIDLLWISDLCMNHFLSIMYARLSLTNFHAHYVDLIVIQSFLTLYIISACFRDVAAWVGHMTITWT